VPREIKPCRERSVGAQLQAAEMPTNIFNYTVYTAGGAPPQITLPTL